MSQHRAADLQAQRIAELLADRIRVNEYPLDAALPGEHWLAQELGVARAVVRRALETVESEYLMASRRGDRWYAHVPPRPQSLSVVCSFAQWADAIGAEPSGRIVSSTRDWASEAEARQLGARRYDLVQRIVRVRGLDGRPVLLQRTVFPSRLADFIASLPANVRSIAEELKQHRNATLGYVEQRVLAAAPGKLDRQLLGISRTTPLLRVIRTTRDADGEPLAHSDDRYISGSVALSIITSPADTVEFRTPDRSRRCGRQANLQANMGFPSQSLESRTPGRAKK